MRDQERDRDFFPGYIFALAFTLINVYAFSITWFKGMKLAPEVMLEMLRALYVAGLLRSYALTKGLAALFIIMTFIIRNGIAEDKTWARCITVTVIGAILFFLPPQIGALRYIITSMMGFFIFARGIKSLAAKFSSFKRRTNDPYETFEQNEILVETPQSMNLRTKYYWKGKWRKGWINVIEQARHTFVCGIPGSGKSYCIIKEQISQDICKGFSMFVYDFKFPELSNMTYTIWKRNLSVYEKKYGNTDNFLVVNYKDPRYSDRCNPLDNMYIKTLSDAMEAAVTIMNDLVPDIDHGSDKFFGPSAMVYIAICIWLLHQYDNGRYCTFPHLIEMVLHDYKEVLLLGEKDEIAKGIFQTFQDAKDPKSMGQLMGQIASARIPLSKMVDSHLYWVMSANDIPLNLNNPEAPKILCVGNVPEKTKVTSTAISLIASRMFKQVNTIHGAPLNINLDECTTFHATGMAECMATCRCNDIGFTIAVQDPNQMFRDWGEKEAKAIIGNLSNQFFGQSLGDYNRHISDLMGKEFREHQSLSSGESDSVSTSYQLEERVSVKDLASLSQGEFIGFAADNTEHPNTLKQFRAYPQIDKKKRDKNTKKGYTIPKREQITPFFNDKEVEDEILANKDKAINDYIYEKVEREENDRLKSLSNVQKKHESVLRIEAVRRIKELNASQKQALLKEIIEVRQTESMEKVLTEHMLKIQREVDSIFEKTGIRQEAKKTNPNLPSADTFNKEGGYNGKKA